MLNQALQILVGERTGNGKNISQPMRQKSLWVDRLLKIRDAVVTFALNIFHFAFLFPVRSNFSANPMANLCAVAVICTLVVTLVQLGEAGNFFQFSNIDTFFYLF